MRRILDMPDNLNQGGRVHVSELPNLPDSANLDQYYTYVEGADTDNPASDNPKSYKLIAIRLQVSAADYLTKADPTGTGTLAMSGPGNANFAGTITAGDIVVNGVHWSDLTSFSYQVVAELPQPGSPSVLYLLQSSSQGSTISYDEYIWITEESRYEMIGSTGSIDLSGYMLKSNPVGSGSFSMNRKSATNVGSDSVTLGKDNTAEGSCSSALSGSHNVITQPYSAVTGQYNICDASHAFISGERNQLLAYDSSSMKDMFVAGVDNFTAMSVNGVNTNSGGTSTILGNSNKAFGEAMFVSGDSNIIGHNYKGTVIGNGNKSWTSNSHILGASCIATGEDHFLSGQYLYMFGGSYDAAVGYYNTAVNSSSSYIAGEYNSVYSSRGSAVFGDHNYINTPVSYNNFNLTVEGVDSVVILYFNNTNYNLGQVSFSTTDGWVLRASAVVSPDPDTYYRVLTTGNLYTEYFTTFVGKWDAVQGVWTPTSFSDHNSTISGSYNYLTVTNSGPTSGYANIEGSNNKLYGSMSHVHVEGSDNQVFNMSYTHVEGKDHKVSSYGPGTHIEGIGHDTTTNSGSAVHIGGVYSSPESNKLEIIGNGTNVDDVITRSNARTLDYQGNEVLAGRLTVGSAPIADMDVATKKYVDDAVSGGGGSSDITLFADTFDDTHTYYAGDYCTWTGKFYRCINSIGALGSFDPNDWTEITTGDELSSHKAAIDLAASHADTLLSLLAPAYDSTHAYIAGDVVTYSYGLYRCTASTTGSWDSSKWTAITVSAIYENGNNIAY